MEEMQRIEIQRGRLEENAHLRRWIEKSVV